MYFLDEMSQDELAAMMKAKFEVDKMQWEQTRLICFHSITAMQGNTVFKKPSDLFTFSWDNKEDIKGKTLTKEEFLEAASKLCP